METELELVTCWNYLWQQLLNNWENIPSGKGEQHVHTDDGFLQTGGQYKNEEN